MNVVLACFIIHNHIIGVDSYNFFIKEICPESKPNRRTINLSRWDETVENMEWITKGEKIA